MRAIQSVRNAAGSGGAHRDGGPARVPGRVLVHIPDTGHVTTRYDGRRIVDQARLKFLP